MLHPLPLDGCYMQYANASSLLSISLWQTHTHTLIHLVFQLLVWYLVRKLLFVIDSVPSTVICIQPLHSRGWVKGGRAASNCCTREGGTGLHYMRYTHWNTHRIVCSHWIMTTSCFGRNYMFFVHEKSKKQEVEEVRRRTWGEVKLCLCVCPNRLRLNTIQSPTFDKKKEKNLWPFTATTSDRPTLMSLTQPRGSTYMVMGTGTKRGAVNVTVVISVMLWGWMQREDGCWNSEQLFLGCRGLRERYEWHSIWWKWESEGCEWLALWIRIRAEEFSGWGREWKGRDAEEEQAEMDECERE